MAETQTLQSRGQYSPPSRNYPQDLPDYWRFEDGTLRTDLPELSDEELHALGWHGPIEMPPIAGTSYFTHNYEWNSETLSFDATEVDEYEKERRVDYQSFWNLLLLGKENHEIATPTLSNYLKGPYYTIKSQAAQSLKVNVIATEFISLLSDAKINKNNANVKAIQDSIFQIIENVNFTPEDIAELQDIFIKSGMFTVYTLEFPDPTYVNRITN